MALADSNPAASGAPRIHSLDIFRGLTVLVMVFADNLSFVKGLPWWTYHMPREANGMTYVDMVFPAFLFLVGMSIPLSIGRRVARGDSPGKIWVHVLLRSLSLVALGLFISNAPQLDGVKAGIGPVAWALLGFLATWLIWHVDPWRGRRRILHRTLQCSGLALFVLLAIVFRRVSPDGQVAWLDFSDWEILGLIGWAYLLASTVYLAFKRNVWLVTGAFWILVAVNAFSSAGWLHGFDRFPGYVRPFEAGLTSIAVAGVLAAMIFLEDTVADTFRAKVSWALGLAAFLTIGARAFTPLGVSKLRDTPSWCLYCAAANVLVVLLLYWLADVDGRPGWLRFIQPLGANPLLAYFLAYVAYFTPRLTFLTADGGFGWQGVLKSLAFTLLVFATTVALARSRVRLQL